MTNKINKWLVFRLFSLAGVILILLVPFTCVVSAESDGYTSEFFTRLEETPADLLSVSLTLPFYGGQRAYIYTNTGFPSNGTALDSTYGQSNAIPYDLGHGHYYKISTLTYATRHVMGAQSNEVVVNDIRVHPEWNVNNNNVNECLYGLRLYIPIAIVSRKTLPDYRLSLGNAFGSGIRDIHVKTTYNYVLPTAIDRGEQVQFAMQPTNQYTVEQDFRQGESVQLFPDNHYPEEGQSTYIITDAVVDISFYTEYVIGGGNVEQDPYEYYANEVPIYISVMTPKTPKISTGISNVSVLKDYAFEQISFNDFNLVDWAITQIQGLLSAPLFGFISLGAILFLVVGIALLFFVLKIFLGG